MKRPLKLYPAFQDYLWGGRRLKAAYPDCGCDPVAEAWVLSCHPDGPSRITGTDEPLPAVLAAHPDWLGERGQAFPFFPILVKLIDAQKPLSVQVHPDDNYARRVEGGFGKTEMWVVLDCQPGAALYYGFTREITKEELARRIACNTLTDVLKSVPVHKGDVFFIPAGTIHAIGAGMLIAEIQQNSNTTYRVYDYGRVGVDGKPRALHVDKALDVTTLAPAKDYSTGSRRLLADCPYFKVERRTAGRGRVSDNAFRALLVVEGGGSLTAGEETMPLALYDCVFLPAGLGEYTLDGDLEVLDITV